MKFNLNEFVEQNCYAFLGFAAIVQRKTIAGAKDDKSDVNTSDGSVSDILSLQKEKHAHSASSLVFGYLNLFSDGVVSIQSLPFVLYLSFTCS